MSFSENLQYLRKKQNLTQEQFAEQMEVSRQAVSKWESGQSYPEMEKLLQICEQFGCSMDSLIKGDVTEAAKEDSTGYNRHMNRYSIMVSSAVALIIFSVAIIASLDGIVSEAVTSIILFVLIGIAVYILIIAGISHQYYRRRYPDIDNFYTEEQHANFNRIFAIAIASGVSLIVFSLCLNIWLEYTVIPYSEQISGGVFLLCTAVAVGIFTFFGMQKDKYDIGKYNQENRPEVPGKKHLASKLCGVIMLLATALFLFLGLSFDMFRSAAVIYTVAGIFCGIVCLLLSDK